MTRRTTTIDLFMRGIAIAGAAVAAIMLVVLLMR